jgi:hypothetical protein
MRHLSIISLLLIAGISFQCSKSDETSSQKNQLSPVKFKLVQQDTVQIPIDSTASNFAPNFQYLSIKNKKILSIYNENIHAIHLFDIAKAQPLTTIHLQRSGINAIPNVFAYLIHNMDSIFLVTSRVNEVILIDSLGIIKNTIPISADLGIKPGYEATVEAYFTPSYEARRNLLTLWTMPLIDNETPEYYRHALALDYNIKQGRAEKHYGHYPETYQKENIYFLLHQLQRLLTPKYDVHYFTGSHELFLYDLQNKELIKKVWLKSDFLPDHIPSATQAGKENIPLSEGTNYFITAGRYRRLLYDSTNRLFYRFVRHSQDLKAPDGLLNGQMGSKISIMIANDSLEFAGEVELPENIYIDMVSFVADGKLWVNINHPDSPLNKEDFLQFIVFKPEQQ